MANFELKMMKNTSKRPFFTQKSEFLPLEID